MTGLIIKDIYTLRKKILYMAVSMCVCDLLLLIVTAVLKHNQDGADYFFAARVEKYFKGGIMAVSIAGIMFVMYMCSIVAIDKKAGWNKMLMAFPVSVWTKSASKFIAVFVIGLAGGMVQLFITFFMFKILKYDIQFGTVKYVYAPFAIGMVFVFLRLIFEYLFNSAIAIEYTAIIAVFSAAACYVVYKFGGIDFPQSKSEIMKMYMSYIDRWLIVGIPAFMAIGIAVAAMKLGKQSK